MDADDAGLVPAASDSLLDRLATALALIGGALALSISALVCVSIGGRWLFNSPVQGDFEIVKMATAVSAFCFLPYCQLRRGNIMVDTFTSQLPQRVRHVIDAIWDFVYAGFAGMMAYCLIIGASETIRSQETTMMLQLPLWPSVAAAAALTVVLCLVAIASGLRMIGQRR